MDARINLKAVVMTLTPKQKEALNEAPLYHILVKRDACKKNAFKWKSAKGKLFLGETINILVRKKLMKIDYENSTANKRKL